MMMDQSDDEENQDDDEEEDKSMDEIDEKVVIPVVTKPKIDRFKVCI